ncbi:unnamed protein product [Aphanomyces euteiches]
MGSKQSHIHATSSQRSRRGCARLPSLPRELLEHIVLFVRDPTDFFHCLDALARHNLLGSMVRPLWKLAQTHDHKNLWPELHIYVLNPAEVATLYAASQCFSMLHFHVPDVTLVKSYIAKTSVSWHNGEILLDRQLEDGDDPIADLPIVHLDPKCAGRTVRNLERLCLNLPRLTHLRSLVLNGVPAHAIEPLVNFIRDSQLTSLKLVQIQGENPRWHLTSAIATKLTHWLTHAPVEIVALDNVSIPYVDAVIASFLKALFYSPTMKYISTNWMSMPAMELVIQDKPLKLTTVELLHAGLGQESLRRLCFNIRDVTTLHLFGSDFTPPVVQALVSSLPYSQIRELSLGSVNLRDAGCLALAKILPRTQVRCLRLRRNYLTDVSAKRMANVVKNAPLLREICLSHNPIGRVGASALIHAIGHRAEPMTRINLGWSDKLTPWDQKILVQLTQRFENWQDCELDFQG